ncbi:Crossover junction endodeoxyribonuclease rusA [Gammaproteobacteria bacterium]
MEFTYQLPWPPSVNSLYKRVSGKRGKSGKRSSVALSDVAAAYYQEIQWTIGKGQPALSGRLRVRLDVFPPNYARRDLDNLAKVTLDSLTHAGIWKDDEQIDHLTIVRKQVEPNGRVQVTVSPI